MTLAGLVVSFLAFVAGSCVVTAIACCVSASRADDREQRALRNLVREHQP